ncbi:hybrid sensor histidine kinase/response regulator [Candidatus Albibeggiatoa sp. nov. BB20]|uniref:hybrid sensor histidine kinase/response regulator n=1 Tax=Candidatus Albibeggiatoa sp. nov. BB20 TaxID=3162723 RepID=UPI0033653B86
MTDQKDTLLIVDDIPANISVLFEFLNKENFKVLVAQDGKRAIEKAKYASPDLILMDVMMPGMNGFDACEALKKDEDTKNIPVIFMTALADTVDKVKGFGLGAADYITKPFQHEEVLARVKTHLQICRLQREMSRQAAELQVKNQQLEAFARTAAHDLKSPLNIVIGYADLLTFDCEEQYPDNQNMINQLKTIMLSGEKMVSIIDALLLLARASKDNVDFHPVEMGEVVEQVVQHRLLDLLKDYNGIVHKPDNWPTVQTYAPWVEEVWANYLSNGLKYGGRPPELELGATEIEGHVRFWVKDNGEGLSPQAKEKLFTPFTRLHENRAEGHGLGLSIVQQIVEKLGGEVGVETELGQGSTFYFTLPKKKI